MKKLCFLSLFVLLPLLMLGGCRAKTGINQTINAAEFVVVRVYENDTVREVTVTDEDDVKALKEACLVRGEYEDGGLDHTYCELIFAGKESEITLFPAYEAADYILTDGSTFYRTGMDKRETLKELLAEYQVFLS